MKTTQIKIDNDLVHKAMRHGGFKRPEDAVLSGLKMIIETPQKINNTQKKKHSAFVEKMTGIMKTDADAKDLLNETREEKFIK